MSEHERYAEELALYALDALRGEERARVDEHLAECAACRRELEQLRGDTALLALSTAGPRPPQRARRRLLDAVAREARVPRVVETSPRRSWWAWLGWAATAAVVIFAVSLWRENAVLKETLASASSQAAKSAREMEELRRIAAPILEPGSAAGDAGGGEGSAAAAGEGLLSAEPQQSGFAGEQPAVAGAA